MAPELRKEFQKNLVFLMRIRYAAIVIAGGVAVWSYYSVRLFPTVGAAYIIPIVALLTNLWAHLRFRSWIRPRATIRTLVILDNILITAATHFSGGLHSPILPFFLGIAVGYGFIVSVRIAGLSLFLSAVFVVLHLAAQDLGLLPVIPMEPGISAELTYLMAWIILLLALFISSAYLGWIVASELRKKEREAYHQARSLFLLHDSLKTFSVSPNLDDLLDRLTRAASALTGLTRSSIYFLDSAGDHIRGMASNIDPASLGLRSFKEARIPIRGTRIEDCLLLNSPLALSDVEAEGSERLRGLVKRLDLKSCLLVPLSFHGKANGVFILWSPGERTEFSASLVSTALNLSNQASIAIENARLFVEQKEALEVSRALVRVSEELIRTVDPDEIKQVVSRLARALVGSDRSGLWLYDEKKDVFVFGESDGLPEEGRAYLRTVPLSASEAPLIHMVLKGKNSIVIEDAPHTTLLPKSLMEMFSVGSIMVTPLYGRKGLMGSLVFIFGPSPVPFSEKARSIAEGIAPIVAVALERAGAFRAIEEKSAQLEAAFRASEWINILGSEREMVESIVKSMERVFPFRHVVVRLWDESAALLRVSYGCGYPDEALQRCLGPGEGLSGAAFQRRETILVHDSAREKVPTPDLDGMRSALILPLVAFGKAWGVLQIESHQPEYFSGGAESVLKLFANQLAVGVRNFRLYEQSGYLKTYLENLIEAANSMIIVTDGLGRIRTVNRKAEMIMGYTKDEAAGSMAGSLYLEEKDRPRMGPAMTQLRSGDTIENFECIFVTKAGEKRHGIFSVAPIFGKDKGLNEIVIVGEDITPMKILEGQIRQSEKLSVLGQLSASIAHELNNPLTMISTHAQLLKSKAAADGRGDDEKRIDLILRSAERIQSLSGGLLSFARPQEDRRGPVNVAEIIDQALLFSEYLLGKRGIQVERIHDPDTPPIVGTRDQILQVFLNLISNSSDAIRGGKEGKIRFTVKPWDGQYVMVEVSDNGQGIQGDHLPRVFEPFFTTKSGDRGTGLGLSIVMRIIDAHQGKVFVKSKVGEGTTMTILLPAWGGT